MQSICSVDPPPLLLVWLGITTLGDGGSERIVWRWWINSPCGVTGGRAAAAAAAMLPCSLAAREKLGKRGGKQRTHMLCRLPPPPWPCFVVSGTGMVFCLGQPGGSISSQTVPQPGSRAVCGGGRLRCGRPMSVSFPLASPRLRPRLTDSASARPVVAACVCVLRCVDMDHESGSGRLSAGSGGGSWRKERGRARLEMMGRMDPH